MGAGSSATRGENESILHDFLSFAPRGELTWRREEQSCCLLPAALLTSMLQAASKAGGSILRQHGLRALPGASQLSAAWLPAAAGGCGPNAAFTTGASSSRSGGGRRTEGAHSAAEKLAAAARESVSLQPLHLDSA